MLKRLHRFILCAAFWAAAWMDAGSALESQAPPPGSAQSSTAGKVSLADGSTPSSQDTSNQTPLTQFPDKTSSPTDASKPAPVAVGDVADTEPPGTVRIVGIITDVSKKYSFLAPNIPIPPFKGIHQWFKDRERSVHCALEWKDDKGAWWFSEMRSSKWDNGSTEHRVGLGQFPTTGYIAYGIFITPGRVPRDIDLIGRTIEVTYDVAVKCDYKKLEGEIRKYGAFGKRPGDPGTKGNGKENCGLGGPAYKPAQNSNTFVSYVLKKCGCDHPAPDMATGWDREPTFPYSTDTRYPKYDNRP